jgi:hypothetical protein
MRIVAVDASPEAGTVSSSIELMAEAAETAGAEVRRVRLADYDIRFCTSCGMCRLTGACKIDDDLPEIAGMIADADGVIFGVDSYLRKADYRVQAILDRLASYFADNGQLRLPGFSESEVPRTPTAGATRRAVIITACTSSAPVAAFFGYTSGPIRDLRQALGRSGIRTVGSLSVAGTGRTHYALDQSARDKARSLGRVLAGKI